MQELPTTLKAIAFNFYRLLRSCTRNTMVCTYLTCTVSYVSIFYVSFLSLCVATQGEFLVISSLQDSTGTGRSFQNSEWFMKYSAKQQSLLHKNSTYMYLCLTPCNFVISSDFVNSICQSLELSTLVLLLIARINFSEFSGDWHNR